jgi:hypothetical protein
VTPPAGARDVEIRVVGPDGRRELRERRLATPGAPLLVEVPPGWLVAGHHQVVVRALDGEHVVAETRRDFDVEAEAAR